MKNKNYDLEIDKTLALLDDEKKITISNDLHKTILVRMKNERDKNSLETQVKIGLITILLVVNVYSGLKYNSLKNNEKLKSQNSLTSQYFLTDNAIY